MIYVTECTCSTLILCALPMQVCEFQRPQLLAYPGELEHLEQASRYGNLISMHEEYIVLFAGCLTMN